MDLNEVLKKAGKHKARKRRGRGGGSGLGGTSGRGHKGARSRSGWKQRYAYEGGQMSLVRRMPKRGFSNALFRKRYDVVNVSLLEAKFENGSRIDLQALEQTGLKSQYGRLKVLAEGELKKTFVVVASKVSAAAREKIEGAGGKVELVDEAEGKKKKGS